MDSTNRQGSSSSAINQNCFPSLSGKEEHYAVGSPFPPRQLHVPHYGDNFTGRTFTPPLFAPILPKPVFHPPHPSQMGWPTPVPFPFSSIAAEQPQHYRMPAPKPVPPPSFHPASDYKPVPENPSQPRTISCINKIEPSADESTKSEVIPSTVISNKKIKMARKRKKQRHRKYNNLDIDRPWVTDELKAEISQRYKFFGIACSTNKPKDWMTYRFQREKCSLLYSTAKEAYFAYLFKDLPMSTSKSID